MTSIAFTTLFLGLVLGTQPVSLTVQGPVAAVGLELDGRTVARIERPPWSKPIDLGREIAPHELVAVAYDRAGGVVARTRQWLNVPRPSAEAVLLLERDEDGRAVSARLTWQSLLGAPPRRVTVSFDGKPLEAADPHRIALPAHERDSTHLLSAEVEFSPAVIARAGVVIGGHSRSEATSELTGVPVRLSPGAALPDPASLRGWLRSAEGPLNVVAVEKGPALLLVVRDTDHTEALAKLGNGGKTTFVKSTRGSLPQYDPDFSRFETRLADEDRVRFLWPRATRAGAEMPTDLFDASRDFTGDFAGLHWLLTRISHPIQKTRHGRFADAVAIAGLQAYGAYSRRAVVLVLGRRLEDESQYPPGLVRSYLERIHVPLKVWSLENRNAARVGAAWGEAEDVSSFPKLKAAFERLQGDLDSQRVIWVEGRRLPQEISLSEQARGIEILR